MTGIKKCLTFTKIKTNIMQDQKQYLIKNLQEVSDNAEIVDTHTIFYWVKDESPRGRKIKGAMVEVNKLRVQTSYFNDFIDIVCNSEDFLSNYYGEKVEAQDLENVDIFYPIPPTHIPRYKIVPYCDPETKEMLHVIGPEELYNIAEYIIDLDKTDSSAFKGNTIFISKLTENKKNFAEVSVILHINPKTGEKYLKPLKITITQ